MNISYIEWTFHTEYFTGVNIWFHTGYTETLSREQHHKISAPDKISFNCAISDNIYLSSHALLRPTCMKCESRFSPCKLTNLCTVWPPPQTMSPTSVTPLRGTGIVTPQWPLDSLNTGRCVLRTPSTLTCLLVLGSTRNMSRQCAPLHITDIVSHLAHCTDGN